MEIHQRDRLRSEKELYQGNAVHRRIILLANDGIISATYDLRDRSCTGGANVRRRHTREYQSPRRTTYLCTKGICEMAGRKRYA
jgi:hypothetical protein